MRRARLYGAAVAALKYAAKRPPRAPFARKAMALSLYAATIPGYQQTLGAVDGLIDSAEAFCRDQQVAPAEIIQARLIADMLPFAYQVKSTVVHSVGAIEGVRRGVFSPDMTPPPETLAALKAKVAEAIAALGQIKPDEVESFIGRDMRFSLGERHLDFTAENFLLSFSQPNFYFHAATAYNILRARGVQIGKRNFMGKLRLKA
jgi:uncharacterized protein